MNKDYSGSQLTPGETEISTGDDVHSICGISREEMGWVAQKGNQDSTPIPPPWVGARRMRTESSKWTTSNCIAKKPAFGFVECIDFLVSVSLVSALIF